VPDGLPIAHVSAGAGGVFLVDPGGERLVADYVYTQPGIALDGRKVAGGTTAGLVLWEVRGPVRVPGVGSNAALAAAACPPA
jgi:hypothetical protein